MHRLVLCRKLINYVPRLFVDHLIALKDILRGQLVSISAEETTDFRDSNVIATIRGRPYLISVVKMDACNHWTFSQAIIQSVIGVGIVFDEVIAVVADSAATVTAHVVPSTCCKSGCRGFSQLVTSRTPPI